MPWDPPPERHSVDSDNPGHLGGGAAARGGGVPEEQFGLAPHGGGEAGEEAQEGADHARAGRCPVVALRHLLRFPLRPYTRRGKTLGKAASERWEKSDKEHKADIANYLNGLMAARKLDAEGRNAESLRKYRDRMARVAERRGDDDHSLLPDKLAKGKSEADRAASEAGKAEAEARWADWLERSKVDRNDAVASASRARAGSVGSGGNRYCGWFRGKDYKTRADYEKAVFDAAEVGGVRTEEVEVLRRNYRGEPVRTRTKRCPVADVVVELEAIDRGDNGNRKMPGVGNGNKMSDVK